jgi:hypothetical protein
MDWLAIKSQKIRECVISFYTLLPNQAVQLTPLARPSPGRDFSGKARPPVGRFANGLPRLERTSSSTGVSRHYGGGLAHCLLLVVPTPRSPSTPASGAANRQRSVAHFTTSPLTERVCVTIIIVIRSRSLKDCVCLRNNRIHLFMRP